MSAPEETVTLVIPKALARNGYWSDMESYELQWLCQRQLLRQGVYDDMGAEWVADEIAEVERKLARKVEP